MRNSFTVFKCPNDTGISHRPKAILCSAWLFVELNVHICRFLCRAFPSSKTMDQNIHLSEGFIEIFVYDISSPKFRENGAIRCADRNVVQ